MSFIVTPHLNFDGHARAALNFYGKIFDADVTAVSYAQFGQADVAKRPDDIIWGQVNISPTQRVMAFDVREDQTFDAGLNSYYLVLQNPDADMLTEKWNALSEGGQVIVPLAESPWSPLYGMLKDAFGVTWALSVPGNGGV